MTDRWLVTGGAGFIGSHLVEHLLRRGDRVVVLDDFSTGARGNLPEDPRLSIQENDLACPDRLSALATGAAGIFHCAANAGVQDCIEDWLKGHATNATATLRVFEAARCAGDLPVIYASSAAVYGDRSGEICHEDLPERPISPYGADKLACEHHARAFWQVHRLPSAGLRLFNVYGPRQKVTSPYSGVLAQFSRNWLTGRPNAVYGDGRQSRDFVHVEDAVAGMVTAMDRLRTEPHCVVTNLCTGRSVSVLELLAILEEAADAPIGPTEFRPARTGEIRHSRGCTRRMIQLLGRAPAIPLEDGLRSYLEALARRRVEDAPVIQAAE